MTRVSKGTKVNRKTKPATIPTKFKSGFLDGLDARTGLSKALRANYDAIITDIGGASETGHVKSALIERFCWLEAILQTLEHDLATGAIDRSEALGKWIQAVNALSGLAKVLGVERQASNQPWLASPSTAIAVAEPSPHESYVSSAGEPITNEPTTEDDE